MRHPCGDRRLRRPLCRPVRRGRTGRVRLVLVVLVWAGLIVEYLGLTPDCCRMINQPKQTRHKDGSECRFKQGGDALRLRPLDYRGTVRYASA